MDNLIRTLVTSFALQIMFFTVAATYKTDKLTDLSYGLTFIALSLLLLFVNPSPIFLQYLIVAMVSLWGIRLAAFLFIRILKTGKDNRFDGVRENFLKFASFWFLQALSVWIIMLPVTFIMGSDPGPKYGIFATLGVIIWLIGFVIETLADFQKYKFKSRNKEGFINTGLWKYSRHPNYFGEMLMWWGIFIFAIPFLKGIGWLSIIGPSYITYLLLKVTGIPPLEKAYDKRFKNDKKYKEYKRKTSILILLPQKNI